MASRQPLGDERVVRRVGVRRVVNERGGGHSRDQRQDADDDQVAGELPVHCPGV